jgi:hypothetical protein
MNHQLPPYEDCLAPTGITAENSTSFRAKNPLRRRKPNSSRHHSYVYNAERIKSKVKN